MTLRIADYALLSDSQSAALVGRDGSIDWWCTPRFDSPSAFARLLDPAAGHWSIRPLDPHRVEREYLEGTMVVRSTFRAAHGVLVLTDALVLAAGSRGHEIGSDVPHSIARTLEVVEGQVPVEVEFAPRLEYGAVTPELAMTERGLEATGESACLRLTGDLRLGLEDGRAIGELRLAAGDVVGCVLQDVTADPDAAGASDDAGTAIDDTIAGWRSWSEEHDYDGAYAEDVKRSALVLQSLTYQPSGTIVAAPTTSLPEVVGGELNWDYRFAWLRDAALTLRALWVAACPAEAGRYFDWMARVAADSGDDDHVQIMFGVEGEHELHERELEHLSGYRGSRPVRVGNEAWTQTQLDVYGEVLDAAYVLRKRIGDFDEGLASYLCDLADRAARTWRQPDAGIWEGREGQRHYVSSKVLCWVALDRAVELAPELGPAADVSTWQRERDAARAEILERGWNEDVGAYTGAFDSDQLDASVLLIPLYGFLQATDERMRRTIDTIERELSRDGLVLRWSDAEDGAFVICSYWLANCLARAGELDRAREIFEKVTSHASDLRLLSEEIDRADGELIGNFPQAFSHVGLINAAWSIELATNPQADRYDEMGY